MTCKSLFLVKADIYIIPICKEIIYNKNHLVNFNGATFVLATHEEGPFSSTCLSGDMKIFFIENVREPPILNS